MLVSTFLTRVNYVLRGTDDDAPAVGTDDGDYWIGLLNTAKDELFEDVSKEWTYSYEVKSLGTISVSAAPSYPLASSFLSLSGDDEADVNENGGLYVIKTDGNRVNIPVVHPKRRNSDLLQAFVAGASPTVYFTQAITSDSELVGGTLYAPGYYMPADVSSDSDTVPVPSATWAVYIVASKVAFNDITYEDKAPDLLAEANDLYTKMVNKNNQSIFKNTAAIPRNYRPILNRTGRRP